MINVNTLTAGLGSPFLAPRGLPIKPAPVPADRAARTLIMSRARVMQVVAVLLMLCLVAAAGMVVLFYPAVVAGDATQAELARNLGYGAGVVGLSVAALTAFYRWTAPWTAPFYALASGVFMSGLALGFEHEFPGIALQSLSLTFAVFLALWVLHGLGLIRVGRRLMVLTYTATAAIGLVYLASFALWLLGQRLPLIHEAGTGGILWMGFIVTVASLNLLVDFERIARLEGRLQPSYMPWFVGLGLMVTLVWLYLSVLRLLARVRR